MESKQGCLPIILVVDDHEPSRRHLMAALAGVDAVTRQAETGQAALRAAVRWLPRVVFIDLYLPDCSGMEVAREIRRLWPASQKQPAIVLVSAENLSSRLQELEANGIDHAIAKPAPGVALRQLTSDLLGQSVSAPGSGAAAAALKKLFCSEIERKLPELEHYLLQDDRERASFLLHQLIASAKMTGEQRLEKYLARLHGLLRQTAGAAEIARAYFKTHRQAEAFIHKTSVPPSG